MKKIKKKIKRALAAFLREELLEFIGYDFSHQPHYVHQLGEFNTMQFRIEIPLNLNPIEQENHIDMAKRKLFESIEPCIQISSLPLTTPQYRYRRYIEMTLRVQKPI